MKKTARIAAGQGGYFEGVRDRVSLPKGGGNRLMEDEVKKEIEREVREKFITLGIDCKEPFELQKDFAFLRMSRVRRENVQKMVVNIFVVCATGGVLFFLVNGLKVWIEN